MNSITFVIGSPPPKTPLVELEQAPKPCLAALKSQKSVAFPNVAMDTNSITFRFDGV